MGERFLDAEEVGSSILLAPTIFFIKTTRKARERGWAQRGTGDMDVTFDDGERVEVSEGTSVLEALGAAGRRAPADAVIAEVGGENVELNRPLGAGGKLVLLSFDEPRGREAYRHTASHVMAQAVKRLYPEAKLAIGPAIEEGFYYDFGLTCYPVRRRHPRDRGGDGQGYRRRPPDHAQGAGPR